MPKKTKKTVLLCLVVFCLSLIYSSLLIENLYFDTHGWQDFEFIKDASEFKVRTMVKDLFFPGLDFLRGMHAQGVRTRIVEAFVLKGVHAFFGWAPYPYFFSKGIILSLVAVVIFLHIFYITNSFFFSVSGALFFLSLPSLFASIFFVYDFDVMVEFFIALVFFLFIKHEFFICKDDTVNKNLPSFVYHGSFMALTLLAFKTKVYALIIPLVIFVYSCFFLRKRIWYYIPFLFFAFLFINPIYPLLFDGGMNLNLYDNNGKSGIMPVFSFYYIYARLFLNKSWDYNSDQTVPVLFSLKESFIRMPNTVSASFGFFFTWFIVLSVIVLVYNKRKSILRIPQIIADNRNFSEQTSSGFKCILFYLLWFFAVLFFYQFDVSASPWGTDMRYMTIAIIPLLLFVFSMIAMVYNYLNINKYCKCIAKIFLLLFIVTFSLTIISNVAHSAVHLKGGYNARNYANMELFNVLYLDYYGTSISFLNFSQNNSFYKIKDDAIISVTLTDYDFLDFGGNNRRVTVENVQKWQFNRSKKLYIVSLDEGGVFTGFNSKLLKVVKSCSVGFFEKLYCQLYQWKNDKQFSFYVYKLQKN